jgi:hypothetical protein
MGMGVEDRLTLTATGVELQPELTVGLLFRDLAN